MEREIERKFLVKDTSFISLSRQSLCIQQAYLSKDPARTVRVRISNDQGWITIKGKSDSSGLSRLEWEKEIPLEEAKELLLLCLPGTILKTRYMVPYEASEVVVDVFEEPKKMILAEVELTSLDAPFTPPNWLGEEVTGNPEYYNSNL